MWKLLERILSLIVLVLFFAIIPLFDLNAETHTELIASNDQEIENLVQFIYTSHIGGMVGGSYAVSNSTYISISGLIQVSQEETNGILHSLLIAHTDTRKLFQDLTINYDSSQIERPQTNDRNNEVSEYYPPKKILAFFFQKGSNSIYEYYDNCKTSLSCYKFFEVLSDFTAKTTLRYANPGLYVRAQRLPASNIQFIKFDLELHRSDLQSLPTLNKILQNEMALVQIIIKNGRAVLTDNVEIKAGQPIHIRIGKDAYLIFPYYYDPPQKK